MIELAPYSNYMMPCEEAVLYCQFLEYNGHCDWRMPTWDEYQTHMLVWGWFLDRTMSGVWGVTPVRDV
jgi:uncharacterized protein YfbU (UPF0304 family)